MMWDLVGHGWAADLLSRHVAEGQVRHAYLVAGPDGVGKRTLALRFCQALHCTAPPSPGGRCGNCRACAQIESLKHPDVHEVARAEGESLLGIDSVRELRRRLSLTSFEGGWRIALLTNFHDATIEAQNALLKTLEEPSPKVVLIVTARQAELLLPTIVSRCEVLALRPVPVDQISTSLENRGEPPERARLLAALSGGRPGVAVQLAADPESLQARSAQLDRLRDLLGASRAAQFAFAEEVAGRRRDVELEARRREAMRLLETWLGLWRDALLAAAGARVAPANPDRTEDAAWMAEHVGLGGARRAVEAVERTMDAVRRNANLQLSLETLFLDLPRIATP
jgi:DNA polymerase-3 subunit delta'